MPLRPVPVTIIPEHLVHSRVDVRIRAKTRGNGVSGREGFEVTSHVEHGQLKKDILTCTRGNIEVEGHILSDVNLESLKIARKLLSKAHMSCNIRVREILHFLK